MDTPLTAEQADACTTFLSDHESRLELYWILNKDGIAERFRINWAQQRLHRQAHLRNNVLKVRQLGISTYLAMLILDTCLFTPNFTAGIIDKTLDDATGKLRKIRYAFENLDYLPDNPTEADRDLAAIGGMLKRHMEGIRFIEKSVIFPNGSRIDIGTSLRGSTLQLLHVSELGGIAVHDPQRAAEIVTGSLNAVGKGGRIYLESTHEGGKYGYNYELICAAMDCIGKPLAPIDYKFFFFPWYEHPEYSLEGSEYHPTSEDERYFNRLQADNGTTITRGQRAWYTAMRRIQKSKMKQEYPSTPEEALNPITDGTIYAGQIATLRERGHLRAEFEPSRHRPIYTAWDIGIGDYMSIWWIQPDGAGKFLLLDNYTANNKELAHYLGIVREKEAQWGRITACITPHDGNRRDYNLLSFDESIERAGYQVIRVPRTTDVWADIDTTRDLLYSCIIHARCSEPTRVDTIQYMSGTDALSNYRTLPAGSNGSLRTTPLHDQCSHACDALRCFAVGRGLITLYNTPGLPQPGGTPASWKGSQSSFVSNFLS